MVAKSSFIWPSVSTEVVSASALSDPLNDMGEGQRPELMDCSSVGLDVSVGERRETCEISWSLSMQRR